MVPEPGLGVLGLQDVGYWRVMGFSIQCFIVLASG